ncbi:DUF2202 domain-containing protein [Thiomicrorhabdus sp. ZW0627]|uniref:DUF2202 domain-containing protein n=1 Tax=Thiomicrorhabdus sp. ZW0627 TaxID=3039774 RepID=UPI0024372CDD|nr:DUF2202 domain-containing protein [Thiomicrorhabdus sp. ZW0627]MDG6773834.1 DUF2202 domain-containing protein [Thiomicrorhabdus sp. ZW0627]
MKHSIKNIFALGLLAAAMSVNASDTTTVESDVVEAEVYDVTLEALSVEEEQGLIFMREEEKLARDVYLTLYDAWGLSVFKNVAESEQKHTDTIALLIEKYQLADPVIDDTVGVFTDYHFTETYEALVEMGSASLEGALQVGNMIEELDIKDIAEAIAKVDGNDDIVAVYEELTKGSRNHLRSFWDVLTKNGFTYEPQFISQEEFDEIINSPMETTNLE